MSATSVLGSSNPTEQRSKKKKKNKTRQTFVVEVTNIYIHTYSSETKQACSEFREDAPCQLSLSPGWTHCRGWRRGSWLQPCEHPRSDWVWRCCLTGCPSCRKLNQRVNPVLLRDQGAEALGHWRRYPTYIMSFWSSATDPKSDSWSRCQDTSSTTAVCPVKMVLASTTLPSFGTALISHRQMVFKKTEAFKHCIFRQTLSLPPPQNHCTLDLCQGTQAQLDPSWSSSTHMIIRSTQQMPTQIWVPRQPVTFLLVPTKTQIRVTLPGRVCKEAL